MLFILELKINKNKIKAKKDYFNQSLVWCSCWKLRLHNKYFLREMTQCESSCLHTEIFRAFLWYVRKTGIDTWNCPQVLHSKEISKIPIISAVSYRFLYFLFCFILILKLTYFRLANKTVSCYCWYETI